MAETATTPNVWPFHQAIEAKKAATITAAKLLRETTGRTWPSSPAMDVSKTITLVWGILDNEEMIYLGHCPSYFDVNSWANEDPHKQAFVLLGVKKLKTEELQTLPTY